MCRDVDLSVSWSTWGMSDMTVEGLTRRASRGLSAAINGVRTNRFGRGKNRLVGGIATGVIAIGWHASAVAQTAGETPSLLTMVSTLTDDGVYAFNALAFAAARANDAAYARLLPLCAGAGSAGCTGATQQLYFQLRALEDNANELLGRGEQTYSLRLSPTGVASALQWTAPEEYAAQGSMTSQFANSQASILTSRFAALHFASMATRLAANVDDGSSATWAAAYSALGGSAGGDVSNFSFGRFSAFVNSGFGAGEKSPTTFEDAFAFDSTEASAGLDYRITDRLVVGLLAGHTERRVDFNSAESIVAGGIRSNGQSGTLYVQYEGDAAYLNGSVGSQHMSLHSQRKITYPSNNPIVPSVNVTAVSDAGAVTTTASVAGGYVWHYKAASVEPYINGLYAHTRIGSFTENASNGFDVRLDGQSIVSSEATVGLKLQYAILPPFGVIVPYIYGEYRHQFAESSRTVGSSYAADGSASSDFSLPTDAAPQHYFVAGAGASIVLPHGIQGFVQYLRVLQYTNYSDHVFSGGLRWEF
jgi:uncharacterized protein YhjY with autotransporter beta-barrel domain